MGSVCCLPVESSEICMFCHLLLGHELSARLYSSPITAPELTSGLFFQVALWNQKAREGVVVWDYHVVLVLRPRLMRTNASSNGETTEADAWVYDFDSRGPLPCRWLGEI